MRSPITGFPGVDVIVSDVVIPPLTAHAPRGPKGACAIVFRVHKAGAPERTPVPEITDAPTPGRSSGQPTKRRAKKAPRRPLPGTLKTG